MNHMINYMLPRKVLVKKRYSLTMKYFILVCDIKKLVIFLQAAQLQFTNDIYIYSLVGIYIYSLIKSCILYLYNSTVCYYMYIKMKNDNVFFLYYHYHLKNNHLLVLLRIVKLKLYTFRNVVSNKYKNSKQQIFTSTQTKAQFTAICNM